MAFPKYDAAMLAEIDGASARQLLQDARARKAAFLKQVFSRLRNIRFLREIVRRYRLSDLKPKIPPPFIDHETRHQFGVAMRSESNRTSGHLKRPLLIDRDGHLFPNGAINVSKRTVPLLKCSTALLN